jgi:hypothetical protein
LRPRAPIRRVRYRVTFLKWVWNRAFQDYLGEIFLHFAGCRIDSGTTAQRVKLRWLPQCGVIGLFISDKARYNPELQVYAVPLTMTE